MQVLVVPDSDSIPVDNFIPWFFSLCVAAVPCYVSSLLQHLSFTLQKVSGYSV